LGIYANRANVLRAGPGASPTEQAVPAHTRTALRRHNAGAASSSRGTASPRATAPARSTATSPAYRIASMIAVRSAVAIPRPDRRVHPFPARALVALGGLQGILETWSFPVAGHQTFLRGKVIEAEGASIVPRPRCISKNNNPGSQHSSKGDQAARSSGVQMTAARAASRSRIVRGTCRYAFARGYGISIIDRPCGYRVTYSCQLSKRT
jgi:hypothetical protein